MYKKLYKAHKVQTDRRQADNPCHMPSSAIDNLFKKPYTPPSRVSSWFDKLCFAVSRHFDRKVDSRGIRF